MFSIPNQSSSSTNLSLISELNYQSSDSESIEGACAPLSGGASPLDLYNGHLPFTDQYVSATRQGHNDPVNWFIPSDGYDPSKQLQIVVKVQPFKAGGYEATVVHQDLHRIADLMDSPPRAGKRESREMTEANHERSVQRSKTKIRHLIKSMGLSCLFTASLRENDPDTYRNPEEWAVLWDRFCRLCRKAGANFEYVAVLEKHKKGNYHLHAAITKAQNHRLLRRLWFIACGGRGDEKGASTPGNIDLSYKQNMTTYQRCAGVARYISKYITKQLGQTEFNKKRYWSTKHRLPAVRRYVLNSVNWFEAMLEMCGLFGLDYVAMHRVCYEYTQFKDGVELRGCWFSYDDDMALPAPF